MPGRRDIALHRVKKLNPHITTQRAPVGAIKHLMCQGLLCLLPSPTPVPDSHYEEGAPEDQVGASDYWEHPHLEKFLLLWWNTNSWPQKIKWLLRAASPALPRVMNTIMKGAVYVHPDWQWWWLAMVNVVNVNGEILLTLTIPSLVM